MELGFACTLESQGASRCVLRQCADGLYGKRFNEGYDCRVVAEEVRGFTSIKALVPFPGGEFLCHDAEPELCGGPRPVTQYSKWGCDIHGLSKLFDYFSGDIYGGTPSYLPDPRTPCHFDVINDCGRITVTQCQTVLVST